MGECIWPLHLLQGFNIPRETLCYLYQFAEEANNWEKELEALRGENETIKAASAMKDRYISELEKQLSLLQKTLDLIDKNGGGKDG